MVLVLELSLTVLHCLRVMRVAGESEIRKWIIENDWLETIIRLPDQLFFNTGITTYFWIVTNKKSEIRKGKVQLIDGVRLLSIYEKVIGKQA